MPIPLLATRAIVRPVLAPWTPLRFTGIWAWWSADLSGVTDEDLIPTWTDASGNGRHATHATGAQYRVDQINSLPAMHFTGERYTIPAFSSVSATAIVIGYNTDPSNGSVWLGSNAGGGNYYLLSYGTGGEVHGDVGAGAAATKAGAVVNTWHVAALHKKASNNTYWTSYNGANGSTQSSANNAQFDRMGYPANSGFDIEGDVTDIILCTADVTAELANFNQWVESRYAIDMP